MIGEVYQCAIQGTHCGAPFSVSLTYIQVGATDDNGLDIAKAFFGPSGPGTEWLSVCSNKLVAQCMSWSSPTDVGAALLEDRVGQVATPAMPPVTAVLMHLRPRTPWYGASQSKPKYDVGRFFLPGLVVADCDQYSLKFTTLTAYKNIGALCLDLFFQGDPGFRLVPFPKWVEPTGGEMTVRSCVPDALVRRIKTRRPNTCELFAGAGQTGGRPVIA